MRSMRAVNTVRYFSLTEMRFLKVLIRYILRVRKSKEMMRPYDHQSLSLVQHHNDSRILA